MTKTKFITIVYDATQFSRRGALAFLFINDILFKMGFKTKDGNVKPTLKKMNQLDIDQFVLHVEKVSKSDPKDYPENCIVYPPAWIDVAKEVLEKLNGGK
jgi:hypothetical protein